MKKLLFASFILLSGIFMTACENKTEENLEGVSCSVDDEECESVVDSENTIEENDNVTEKETGIDYLVLVNKQNKLPDDWESKLDLVEVQNAYDETIKIERQALEKYNELKADLAQEGVEIDLDSVYRSVEKQQQVWDEFEQEKGLEYAQKYVAVPGYSEHHTALALDIVIRKDGVLIYENEDMIAEPEIFAKIHAKLADHGFILRYLEGKDDITGYSYEPRHIRYVGDVNIAKEIMENGLTLEEYLENNNKGEELITREKYLENADKEGYGEEVKIGDNITVDYIGRLEDGTVFDTSVESVAKSSGKYYESRDYSEGLTFDVGAGQMIKGFDNGVVGMKVGQTKTVQFGPEEGYGEYDEKLVITYPESEVGDLSQFKEGDTVYLGLGYPAKVIKVTDKDVTLDFNSELAGKNLIFDITVKSIN